MRALRRQAGKAGIHLGPLAEALEDPFRQRGVEQRLPRPGAADRVEEVEAAHLLEDIAGRPRHDGGDQRLVVGVGREHDARDLREARPDLPTDLDAAAVGQAHVEDGHVGPGGRDAAQGLSDRAGLADHLDVVGRLEERPQAGPHHLVVVEQEDTQAHGLHLLIWDAGPPTSHGSALLGMGKLGFVPFRLIEDPTKLRRVLEATLLIESNLELPEVRGTSWRRRAP